MGLVLTAGRSMWPLQVHGLWISTESLRGPLVLQRSLHMGGGAGGASLGEVVTGTVAVAGGPCPQPFQDKEPMESDGLAWPQVLIGEKPKGCHHLANLTCSGHNVPAPGLHLLRRFLLLSPLPPSTVILSLPACSLQVPGCMG